jgi:hypothetical protein
MTEPREPRDRAPPQSTVQAAGQVAEDVVAGLKGQPLLLGIVVLNLLGIAAALYFLNLLATNNAAHITELMKQSHSQFETVLRLCAPQALPLPPR